MVTISNLPRRPRLLPKQIVLAHWTEPRLSIIILDTDLKSSCVGSKNNTDRTIAPVQWKKGENREDHSENADSSDAQQDKTNCTEKANAFGNYSEHH